MMFSFKRIVGFSVFAAFALLILAACGQKGALKLPKESAAQNRAALPQVLNPAPAASSTASSPASPASAPKR